MVEKLYIPQITPTILLATCKERDALELTVEMTNKIYHLSFVV